jgi:PBSX family phage terminase large subunit
MNCNPEGPHHYIKEEFIDKAKEKNVYHLHFTMDDNLTLSQKIKDRYKRMFTGVFFKRFILGLWVAADGLIYQLFADNSGSFIIDDEWLKEQSPRIKSRGEIEKESNAYIIKKRVR